MIKGDESELKSIAKLEKIKELRKMGIKISYKTVNNGEENQKVAYIKMSYKDRLYTEIKQDKEQLEWFNKLF